MFGGGFLVGVIFQGKDTLHTDPDDARPRIGGLQQISAQSPFDDNFTLTSTEESVSEDLDYLERLGLSKSNSDLTALSDKPRRWPSLISCQRPYEDILGRISATHGTTENSDQVVRMPRLI